MYEPMKPDVRMGRGHHNPHSTTKFLLSRLAWCAVVAVVGFAAGYYLLDGIQ
jgi:hypothetical protein